MGYLVWGPAPQALAPVPWWASPVWVEIGTHRSQRPWISVCLSSSKDRQRIPRRAGRRGPVCFHDNKCPSMGCGLHIELCALIGWPRSWRGPGRGCLRACPQIVPGLLGVTRGVRGQVTRAGGTLPWRGLGWDGSDPVTPPSPRAGSSQEACWEGSLFLMNKLLSLLAA